MKWKALALLLTLACLLIFLASPIPGAVWDVSTASYDNLNFSVVTQDGAPQDFFFNSTGTKMYMVGSTSDVVYRYSLSQPWNISTATWDGVNSNFSVTTQDTTPNAVFFNGTGTKMYVIGAANDRVYSYTLSTAWNTSTATWDGANSNFSIATQDGTPRGLFFNTNGTRMFMVGAGTDRVFQYTLSAAWNISTATWDGNNSNFSIATGGESNVEGMFINSSGTRMYILGNDNDTVYSYTLSTPWNTSTATYDNINLSISSQDTIGKSVFVNETGTKMFIIGATNDMVYQYSLPDTADDCTCTDGAAWTIDDGSTCVLTTTCNLGSNKFRLASGKLRIASTGKLIAGAGCSGVFGTSLTVAKGGSLVCR